MRNAVLIVIGLIVGMAPLGQHKKTTSERNKPPTIKAFTSSVETIPYCPFPALACSNVDRKVRLSPTVDDSEKRPLTYSYSVSAGRIEGEGPAVIWDLADAIVGQYTARVLVKNMRGQGASASLVVRIVECGTCDPPLPPCPQVFVTCPSAIEKDKPVTFVATVTGGEPYTEITYSWTTTFGKIVDGKYENRMTLDLLRYNFEEPITATVEVGGYDPSCRTTASCTIGITE